MTEHQLERSISRIKKQIADLESREKNLSIHGHWDLGYYKGKLSVLEDWLDNIRDGNPKPCYIGNDSEAQIKQLGDDIYNLLPDYDVNERDCQNAAKELYEKGHRKLSDKVIETPCLVGDSIWYIDKNYTVQEAQVVRIVIDGFYSRYVIASRYDYETEDTIRLALRFEDLNTDYWLTKEPAEERLKEIINSMKLTNKE